ncbi:hypothetical protein ACIG0C_33305 [Kitasatospora aureofaciens]|uniref:PknH-like extracellular domain-containing protein n=1 Tax=Kitasatospora aureofaciens TaxID=1894 RepID=A0A1E7NEI5_KITAU|nr:hypothetical protein [Kitasatospora aureofaciens]ARF83315.1 hypothetical protein B6264_30795 [Kitasatospora aureofaciens]OEV39082.1 hypothetical protein HS99_0018515 [Kitasatospora aureofaciens]
MATTGSAALVVTALGALLTGCAGPNHPVASSYPAAAAPTLADISATPSAAVPSAAPTDLSTLRLPIEQYVLTPAENAELTHATWVLAADCIQHHGITFPTPAALTGLRSGSEVPRRYGPADPAAAAKYGYHNPPAPDGNNVPTDNLSSLPTAQRTTVFSCHQDAQTRLTGGATFGSSPIGEQINSRSYTKAADDDRVKAAFTAWSACMKNAGYTYASPIDAYNDPHWQGTSTAGQQEIATAQADIACKQQTNLIGTWYAVDAAYQQQQIHAHQSELDRDRTAEQQQLTAARKALGQSG